eukprot:5791061-Amphidinium_carterae.2
MPKYLPVRFLAAKAQLHPDVIVTSSSCTVSASPIDYCNVEMNLFQKTAVDMLEEYSMHTV